MLVVKAKNPPGGVGPSVPFDPLESRLANQIQRAILAVTRQFDPNAFAEAIRGLDPDLVERLLEPVSIDALGVSLEETFTIAALRAGDNSARSIMQDAPRIGQNPFIMLEPGGRMLPNGIVLPAPVVPVAPDVEFALTDPVTSMFNRISVRSAAYAAQRSSGLIREISDSTRLTIRRIVTTAFTEPTSVDVVASRLRSVLGLHSRWGQAVMRFEDRNFRALLREGVDTDIARARAADMAVKYRNKLVRRRAETIARTELQSANNFGRIAGWQGADAAGLLDARSMKRWITAPERSRYGPPCPICTRISGEEPVPWDGVFSNGAAMPPAHPNCRCTAVLLPPTRGLEGLPSQDLSSWIARLDAMEAEYLAGLPVIDGVITAGVGLSGELDG